METHRLDEGNYLSMLDIEKSEMISSSPEPRIYESKAVEMELDAHEDSSFGSYIYRYQEFDNVI